MSLPSRGLLLLVTCGAVAAARGEPLDRQAAVATLAPKLDALFAGEVKAHDYPGLGVGIVLDGKVVYAKGFGFRDLATRAPFQTDTVFRIASVTKGFVAMTFYALRDGGRLSLDAPARGYDPSLAALALPTKDAPPITIRQLLTHGSGLPEDNYWVDVSEMSDADLDAMVASGMTFAHAPDTAWQYSNVGYALAGRVLARIAGRPAREVVRTTIVEPLGMTSTGWSVDEIARARLAVGYWGADGYAGLDKQKIAAPIGKLGALDPAGGLFSTIDDMTRYLAFHLAAWPPRDAPDTGPVRRSTLRELQQGTRRGDFGDWSFRSEDGGGVARLGDDGLELYDFSYGGGLFTATTCADDFLVEHSGGLPGYTTWLTMLPDAGYGIILFINDSRTDSRPDIAATELFRAAGLLEPPAVPAHPALEDARASVDRLLVGWDPPRADALFEPTFFRYQSNPQLGEAFAALSRDHGACRPAGPLIPHNRLRARWQVACDRGAITFAAALSPRAAPRLQFLRWSESFPPDARLERAAAALTRLANRWSPAAARALLAPGADLALAQAELLRGSRGATCRLGPPMPGAGKGTARFALTCGQRSVRLALALDEKSGRIKRFVARPVRGPSSRNCAP